MRRRPAADVAIYAPFAGPLYEQNGEATGGAELQTFYLTQALARAGLRVRHLVVPRGELSVRFGVELVPMDRTYDSGGLARRRAIVAAVRVANARVYVQRSASFETGIVGGLARAQGRRFIFSSSSTADFARDLDVARQAGTSLDHWPSDEVVVQTNEQRALAQTNFRIDASIIRSFAEAIEIELQPRDAFLWIGALIGIKDPLAYVELARRAPAGATSAATLAAPGPAPK